MIIKALPLIGSYLVEIEKREDHRGFFARTFCQQEFSHYKLSTHFVQSNTSFNYKAGTIRGLHFQYPPHTETKFIRVTKGAIYDVIVDIRPFSPTFKQWYGIELNEENHLGIYVPKGFGHGYQTLTDNTEAFYMVDNFYNQSASESFYPLDPTLNISWPLKDIIISDQDKKASTLQEIEHKLKLLNDL